MKGFNVRVLSVNASTFDTPMATALQYQTAPLEKDYETQEVGIFMSHMKKQAIPIRGDTQKAIKAIYEVIVGEGIGEGHEDEPVLPLGGDMVRHIKEDMAKWEKTLEVFGDVAQSTDKPQ